MGSLGRELRNDYLLSSTLSFLLHSRACSLTFFLIYYTVKGMEIMKKLCDNEVRWMIQKYKITTRKQFKRQLFVQRFVKTYFPYRTVYTSPSLRMSEINLDVTESLYSHIKRMLYHDEEN